MKEENIEERKRIRHYFDLDMAIKYGLECAIVYEFIKICCANNKQKEKYEYQNKVFTRISNNEMLENLPYLTKYKIRMAIKVLQNDNKILVKNLNYTLMDKTLWYAVI